MSIAKRGKSVGTKREKRQFIRTQRSGKAEQRERETHTHAHGLKL